MGRIVDIEPLLDKYNQMNEGTEFSPIHFINDLMALEVHKEQPSEDCISREAVMQILDEVAEDFDTPRDAIVSIDGIADMIAELPYVIPQQEKDFSGYEYSCPVCGKKMSTKISVMMKYPRARFFQLGRRKTRELPVCSQECKERVEDRKCR